VRSTKADSAFAHNQAISANTIDRMLFEIEYRAIALPEFVLAVARGNPSMLKFFWRNLFSTLVVICFAAFLLAPLWLDRNDPLPGAPQNKCEKHLTDPAHDPRRICRPNDDIKIIRLTNSGEFADRCELTNALYELNWDRDRPSESFGAAACPDAQSLPKLAVLYIHGWKHDASPDDDDLKNFTALIHDLRKRHANNKHVVGIFVGWNASAGLPGLLENVSFWVKKTDADRIAQSSVVTKIVSSMGAITKAAPGRADQFITIGHSFGARMLFSATTQSLIYETEKAHPGFPRGQYKLVEGSADAVILLNPAFEASRYSAVDDITRYEEHFSEKQPPLIITVATDNDWATQKAFPIGQWLGLARSDRELTTLGNYQPFFTHALTPLGTGNCRTSEPSSLTENFGAAKLCLSRTSRINAPVQPHNPFIVARTSSDIIDGHNGIWGAAFTTWLAELVTALEARNDEAASIKERPTR
jgi:hypothetical protein